MPAVAPTLNISSNWTRQGSPFGIDLLSLIFALGMHLPLYFMKFDVHKKAIDRPGERLVSIDLIEPEKPKPVEEVPVVPPPPPKETGLMAKLKALVHKEPPPPPPPAPKPPAEKIIQEVPKPLALQPKMDLPKVAPALESKANFKTAADPKLLQDQQKLANAPVPGIAPMSALKLGVNDNRAAVKNSKGNFQISKNETLKGIGDGPGLAGNTAPTIAIRTGNSATTEKLSAPVTQHGDKGHIGAVPTGNLNTGPALGLRDSIIARDAVPSQIGGTHAGGVPGGIPGGIGNKHDAGHLMAGSPGGTLGGTVGGTGSAISSVAPSIPKKKEKPSMFSITGPLSDRKIEKSVPPEYPVWAQEQGISAIVVLEFTVDPQGVVKNTIVVRKTSGYPKLDETAVKALLQWKFVALTDGSSQNQVGLITFNYSLN